MARKVVKSRVLDEAVKRTGLGRKVMIRKLTHPAQARASPTGQGPAHL